MVTYSGVFGMFVVMLRVHIYKHDDPDNHNKLGTIYVMFNACVCVCVCAHRLP